MKDLVLDQTLIIGVDEIDDDHGKLVNLFNILNRSVAGDADSRYIEAVLEELINCTVWHFSHEERLMLKYGYDAYDAHREEHQDLIDSIKELQKKFLQTGKIDEKDDLEFLERWLTEHILVADIRLGAFLINVM